MKKLYIIESRNEDGSLKLDGPQPESVFGHGVYSGMSDWDMSRVIYARNKECSLSGDNIPNWPKLINPNWVARVKTW